jgi:glyoxylase-like metal-dependent hydrolase (beta-lactamase superfamily II)
MLDFRILYDYTLKYKSTIMKLLKRSLLLITLLLTIGVHAQNKEVKIKINKLTNNIYMLVGQGGNIAVFVGEDGVFMLDDQFAPLTPKILAAIKTITDKPVKYLINTHWHGDHTGGNLNMAKEGAIIVSHDNVRKRMSMDQVIRGRKRKASPKEALPIITFTEDMMYHFNGDDVLISHIHDAHTDGDALVYFTNNNVLHMGDAYFQGKFPYIDISSGGSIDGYIAGIQKAILLSDDKTIIVPGHGKISNKSELKPYLLMLKTLRNRVQSEIDNGKTLKQVVSDLSITANYKSFSGWITEERIKTAIYTSLQK